MQASHNALWQRLQNSDEQATDVPIIHVGGGGLLF